MFQLHWCNNSERCNNWLSSYLGHHGHHGHLPHLQGTCQQTEGDPSQSKAQEPRWSVEPTSPTSPRTHRPTEPYRSYETVLINRGSNHLRNNAERRGSWLEPPSDCHTFWRKLVYLYTVSIYLKPIWAYFLKLVFYATLWFPEDSVLDVILMCTSIEEQLSLQNIYVRILDMDSPVYRLLAPRYFAMLASHLKAQVLSHAACFISHRPDRFFLLSHGNIFSPVDLSPSVSVSKACHDWKLLSLSSFNLLNEIHSCPKMLNSMMTYRSNLKCP